MQTLTQSVLSTQYMQVLIQVTSASPHDPTGDPVSFAFTPANTFPAVEPSTWYTGSWVTFPGSQYWAEILIGPANGGVSLATGAWQVWVKITDSPEVPVLQPCLLTITP